MLGAIIGLELLVTLGVTPNISLVGALVAIALAWVPFGAFRRCRSIHGQNLAPSAIAAATFGAANSPLLPIGVPWILGPPDLIFLMFAGVACAMLVGTYLLFRIFGTSVFPARGAWPPGIAAGEAIRAGDEGGGEAANLGIALLGADRSMVRYRRAGRATAICEPGCGAWRASDAGSAIAGSAC